MYLLKNHGTHHLFEHLNNYQALCDEQHGFRQCRSCETQLITTVNDFAQYLNQGSQCDALFLYFSKAFDKVPYLYLFNKLQFYGIHGPLLHWIKNFLTSRSQEVIIKNEHSHACNVLSGVPQGTVQALLLFFIYTNDLPLHISNKVRLYADDVVLYSNIHSVDDCHNLQKDPDSLSQWSHRWQMLFNLHKCKFFKDNYITRIMKN